MSDFQPQIVAFCCTHCAYNAADLAGSLRIQYPSALKIVQVLCSGRVDVLHILRPTSEQELIPFVRFEEVDATNLDFDDASFDVVSCQFGVMFFPDKDRSYREVHRVLKPGGAYVFNVWDSWETNPFAQVAHEVVEEFFPEDPPGFYKIPFGYHDADEIEAAVLQAGFSRATIEHVPLTSKIPSANNFAKGAIFGNPLYDEIITRGGDPQEILVAMTEAIDKRLGAEMPLQALFIHASKD